MWEIWVGVTKFLYTMKLVLSKDKRSIVHPDTMMVH
jgi:hypothetical protein